MDPNIPPAGREPFHCSHAFSVFDCVHRDPPFYPQEVTGQFRVPQAVQYIFSCFINSKALPRTHGPAMSWTALLIRMVLDSSSFVNVLMVNRGMDRLGDFGFDAGRQDLFCCPGNRAQPVYGIYDTRSVWDKLSGTRRDR